MNIQKRLREGRLQIWVNKEVLTTKLVFDIKTIYFFIEPWL